MAPRVCDKCGEWLTLQQTVNHVCKEEFLREMRLRNECEMKIHGRGIWRQIDEIVRAWCKNHHPEKLEPEIWCKKDGIFDAIEALVERIEERNDNKSEKAQN